MGKDGAPLQKLRPVSCNELVDDCSDHRLDHVIGGSLAKPPKPFKALFSKLKRLKEPLKKLNTDNFSGILDRVVAHQQELEYVQELILNCPTVNISREKEDENGLKLGSFEAISSELIRHFTNSLGVVHSNVSPISYELLKEILGVELTSEMSDSLVQCYLIRGSL
ncbi:hypothetical protein V6N12_047040 [Hibiscus sabdariffa]|uniref:Uncharacterized protein n=2 Tax=Hibiscus sabdariffa TaxID=183260 RepID=A0ABR1ZQM2_9ROSI